MPVVFRAAGSRFHFFSNEGDPREPIHIHARRGDAEAKIWLLPTVEIADSYGYTRREQTELIRLVVERREEIMEAWYDHFG